MTTTGDGHTNSADCRGTRSSAELIHVLMPPGFLGALVHSSGVSVERLFHELRGDLVLRPRSTPPPPAVLSPEPAIAEKVRTVSLVHATPQQADHGADVVLVQRVDGQLCTLLVQAKWSPHTRERERARLGIFAALNARRAILESLT
ncbi:MAG TPA: hypothetical protein VLD61_07390, partial [Methylomirabilota bacterium]|nr:hypothetical protein [Methylomirabilota bacterium]